MANQQKLQYIIELLTQGDTAKASSELNKLEKQSEKTSVSLGAIRAQIAGLIATLGGTAFLSSAINEFVEAERATARLNAVLQSTGKFSEETAAKLSALAEALAATTGFTDESITGVIAKLVSFGARTGDLERLTTLVLDLSTLLDKDLNRAAITVGKALRGDLGAFKELGFVIDETKTIAEQLNQVMDQAQQRFGGQATKAVETLGGSYERMKKQLGEVKEAFGGVITTAIEPFIGKITEAARATENFLKDNRRGLGNAAADIIKSFIPGGHFLFPEKEPTPPPMSQTPSRFTLLQKGLISTDAIDDEQIKRDLEEIWSIEDEMLATLEAQVEVRARIAKSIDEASLEEQRRIVALGEIEKDTINELTLMRLTGANRVREQIDQDHEKRIAQIRQLHSEDTNRVYELMFLENERHAQEIINFEESISYAGKLKQDMIDMSATAQDTFASGLATAIVGAFEEGDKAFQKFASNFLRAMAEMILQTLILRAVQAGIGAFGGGGFDTGPSVPGSRVAGGGQFTRMAGGGMAMFHSPVRLPRFNVLAAEAGSELLTVMARPSRQLINGIPAQVGRVGGQNLAITNADALASGGMGGEIVLRVTHPPEVRAEIVASSVKRAKVEITRDMQSNTEISQSIKKLTS